MRIEERADAIPDADAEGVGCFFDDGERTGELLFGVIAERLPRLPRRLHKSSRGAQVEELGRIGRLKRFLAPQLAELIVSQDNEKILESHRREIVVVFCDLRGYTAFTETAEPEEVLDFLREYHIGTPCRSALDAAGRANPESEPDRLASGDGRWAGDGWPGPAAAGAAQLRVAEQPASSLSEGAGHPHAYVRRPVARWLG